jgi:uncharacterized protein YecT (DUF1311 family)
MFRPVCTMLLCIAGHTASAQDIDCANAMAQQDLNQCAYADWEAADAKLNTAYRLAINMLEGWDADLPAEEQGGAEALREAQRAWITFRDKACEAEGYAMKGGSAEPLLVYGCMRLVTEERSAHLEAMVEGFDG